MKTCDLLESIVSCMEKHPCEKDLLSKGASILSKIVTMSDLNKILEVLKSPEFSLMNIEILSQLALIEEMMEEMVKKNVFVDLLKVIELNIQEKHEIYDENSDKNKEKINENKEKINENLKENFEKNTENSDKNKEKITLIKNCCVALGRIIEADSEEFVMGVEGFGILKKLLENNRNCEVFEAVLTLVNKLQRKREVCEILKKNGFFELFMEKIECFFMDEQSSEAFSEFLLANYKEKEAFLGVLEILLKILSLFCNKKGICEKVSFFLFFMGFF